MRRGDIVDVNERESVCARLCERSEGIQELASFLSRLFGLIEKSQDGRR